MHSLAAPLSLTHAQPHSPHSQRTKNNKNPWRIASARAGSSLEEDGGWRRSQRELRAQLRGLRSAISESERVLWRREEAEVVELERLIAAAVGDYTVRVAVGADGGPGLRFAGSIAGLGEAEMAVENGDRQAEDCDDASVAILVPQLEGTSEDEDDVAMTRRRPQSEELAAKPEGLSTGRRLKRLDVHDYVHSALRASHLRTWLQDRGIAE